MAASLLKWSCKILSVIRTTRISGHGAAKSGRSLLSTVFAIVVGPGPKQYRHLAPPFFEETLHESARIAARLSAW